ncbi:MAG: hypothetical protein FJX47_14300 [Alphaproteobacteria bacterium]|nr:hypothetical protein [Alphaproteobacteria bacterium]
MTTRVSTLGLHGNLTGVMLSRQRDQFEVQQQISTGLKSQTFQGIARDAAPLSIARETEAKRERYQRNISETNRWMQLYDQSFKELREMTLRVRDAVMVALGTNNGTGLDQTLQEAFSKMAGILNTSDGGKYIFSGSKTSTAPMSTTNPTTFAALGAAANVFQNDTINAKMQVDDSYTITYGTNASAFTTDIMTIMHSLLNGGTYSNPLTAAQITTLQTQLANFQTLDPLGDIAVPDTLNGLNMKNVKDVQERHEAGLIYIRSYISDIQDVDTAEAITKLNLDQTAVEASMKIVSSVGRMSLLDFL